MELARLSNGQIIGLDINQPLLDRLRRKIEKAGLSDRVKTLKRSMFDMDFPDESFDIIWAHCTKTPGGLNTMLLWKSGLMRFEQNILMIPKLLWHLTMTRGR